MPAAGFPLQIKLPRDKETKHQPGRSKQLHGEAGVAVPPRSGAQGWLRCRAPPSGGAESPASTICISCLKSEQS